MNHLKFWLYIFLLSTLLSACGRPYVAKMQFEDSVNDFSVLESDFGEICPYIYPNASTYEVDDENHDKVIFCGVKDEYHMELFSLIKPKKIEALPLVKWVVMGGHFGTRIGNSHFPKWYCEKYNDIYKAWYSKHKIGHDEKLLEKCKAKLH